MNKPTFVIIDQRELEDGSLEIDIEYTKEFADIIKKHYGRKRMSKKLIQRAVIEGFENYLEEQNVKK